MKIIEFHKPVSKKTAIAIGMFDGVHLGHKALISQLLGKSDEKNLCPVIYTFSNHPIKEAKRKLLTTLNEKLYIFEKLDVENIYIANLEEDLMTMSPEEFVKKELVKTLNCKLVIVGENFRFGHKKEGNVNTLKELGKIFNFEVIIVNKVLKDGVAVSSSLIHDLILGGEIEEGNSLLGHPYFVQGIVERGKGLGRHLGFPTANLAYENGNKLLPKNGVYITIGNYNGILLKGVTNVGFNPTFEDKKNVKIESHFLDVENDFYGKFLRLYFIKRLRDEIKYEKVQDLRNQVMADIEETRKFFESNPIESIALI
ncbi:bifunctional riboflavin kinase/FAD synthetase [Caldisericum exile]|uniref:Riboflavin biosynthesis protein n=1 Tax=Caldisericum exile (strain DSM 21853 / NBRC 104410 / AZM16c01) TaxID=511051 RepID=A0A7U6JGP8_CALEA|nr:bifunctional riboflavin kinase/FAD synthetase [Caldisericum exile]BAL80587.1 riboflavin kinase/FMN adenylyltransferase [Caldisericum exile AZM16c01]